MIRFFWCLLCIPLLWNCTAQSERPFEVDDVEAQTQWVDSLYNQMSLREKIGQLMMLPVYTNENNTSLQKQINLITKTQVGGVIFMKGDAKTQDSLTRIMRGNLKWPLMTAIDGEWGLNMRLSDTHAYPWNLTLGAVTDNDLIKEMGALLAQESNALGLNINFAPVVDVNTNPKNPIIGNRSFGEDKMNVTAKSKAFIEGLQKHRVMASAKHFPGHGDTSADSHLTLPNILHDSVRIKSVEMYPFEALCKTGLGSVMVAHLNIPNWLTEGKPTTLSRHLITDVLKKNLGFEGLVVTDALNMKGVSTYGKPENIALEAFLAGNDVLLFPGEIKKTIKYFIKSYRKGLLSEERLAASVKKILKAKYWMGLSEKTDLLIKYQPNPNKSIEAQLLNEKLYQSAITLLKNDQDVLPLKDIQKKIGFIALGAESPDIFENHLNHYAKVDKIDLGGENLEEVIKGYDELVVGFFPSTSNPWKSYAFSKKDLDLLDRVTAVSKPHLQVFTSPYALLQIKNVGQYKSVVVAYQNEEITQKLAAQLFFGVLPYKGKLPVSIAPHFELGVGYQTKATNMLGTALPESVGMSSIKLKKIDSLMQWVLKEKMTPGAQILIARKGKVVYEKGFGYYTYDSVQKVTPNAIYDLASLTKILAGVPLIMKGVESNSYSLKTTLNELIKLPQNSNKKDLTVKQMLSHNAQLQAWIPFHLETLDADSKQPKSSIYRTKPEPGYDIQVSEKLYISNHYKDTIYQRIIDSDLRAEKGYKYSGLPFYLFRKVIEDDYQKPMDQVYDSLFVKPLGLHHFSYHPLEHVAKSQIVPTEKDTYFRNELLRGHVHDMGAAMLGGVSGNSGLFGNARDVATIMQLFLQEGQYGGKRYFRKKTLDVFNKRYYVNDSIRRGLGFDKPQINPEIKATCGCVSNKSFGHSGYTGTYAWADPETDLIYVFLSNRLYPDDSNTLLVEEDIRTRVHQLAVEAIE